MARLNLSSGEADVGGMPRQVTHGLWLLDLKDLKDLATATADAPQAWAPVGLFTEGMGRDFLLGKHGDYDACSTSYGNAHGVRDGFILDATRQRMAFTARPHDPARGMSDKLILVETADLGLETAGPQMELTSGKGCHVPVALAVGGDLVYHFRSPMEAGDLWRCTTSPGASPAASRSADRLTHTMPPAMRAKLSAPEELVVGGRHVLLFRPPPDASGAPKPALVWAHGGPMTAVSFDYNPIAAWLAQHA